MKGNREQALARYRAALAIAEELIGANPRQKIYQFALASSLERIGDVQLYMQQAEAALDSYGRKRDILKQLLAEEPETGEWERDLIIAHVKVGDALKAKRAAAREVRDSYTKALTPAQKMQAGGRLDPADAEMIPDLRARVATWSRFDGRISERLMSGQAW
jgi:tetratricopeptide (TPR) repeat protein